MEIVERVIQELRPIAEKIGEGAEFLWETLITQIIIRGVASSVFCTVLLIISTVAFSKFFKVFLAAKVIENSYYGRKWSQEKWGALWGVILSGTVFLTAIMVISFYSIPRLLNPAYYALAEILKVVGQ